MEQRDIQAEEKQKLLLECENIRLQNRKIERDIRTKWYQKRVIAESIIGGVIAAVIIAGWYSNVYFPFQKELREIESKKNKIQVEKISMDKEKVEIEKRNVLSQLKELKDIHEQLSAKYKNIYGAYKEISQSYKNQEEKLVDLSKRLDINEKEKKSLMLSIERSKADKKSLDSIFDQIKNDIKDNRVRSENLKSIGHGLLVSDEGYTIVISSYNLPRLELAIKEAERIYHDQIKDDKTSIFVFRATMSEH